MTHNQLAGMIARAEGTSRRRNPFPTGTPDRMEWWIGYDMLDTQIRALLDNARQMVDGFERARARAKRRRESEQPGESRR